MTLPRSTLAALAVAALAACDSPTQTPAPIDSRQASFVESDLSLLAGGGEGLGTVLADVNALLAARGIGVAVSHAEWIDGTGDTDAEKIVFANNRTLRLGTRWVPGDPRRGATSTDLT